MGLSNLDIEKHLVEHSILNLGGQYLKLDTSNDPLTGELVSNYGATFNEGGNDSDFRVEGLNQSSLLFVDAAVDRVGIGEGDFTVDPPQLQLEVRRLAADASEGFSTYSDGNTNESSMIFRKSHQDTVGNTATVDTERLGAMTWEGNNGTAFRTAVVIRAVQNGVAGTQIPADLLFLTGSGAATSEKLRIGTDSVTVNEDGNDFDFRVEGATIPDLFNVDAGNDKVAVGTASDPYSVFEVGGSRTVNYPNELVGMRSLVFQQGTGNVDGFAFGGIIADTNTANIQQLAAFRSSPHNQGSGNVGVLIGGDIRVVQNNVASTVGSSIGMRIRTPDLRLGRIDNNCGLFIGNHSGIGDVTNYAIQTEGGDVNISGGNIVNYGRLNMVKDVPFGGGGHVNMYRPDFTKQSFLGFNRGTLDSAAQEGIFGMPSGESDFVFRTTGSNNLSFEALAGGDITINAVSGITNFVSGNVGIGIGSPGLGISGTVITPGRVLHIKGPNLGTDQGNARLIIEAGSLDNSDAAFNLVDSSAPTNEKGFQFVSRDGTASMNGYDDNQATTYNFINFDLASGGTSIMNQLSIGNDVFRNDALINIAGSVPDAVNAISPTALLINPRFQDTALGTFRGIEFSIGTGSLGTPTTASGAEGLLFNPLVVGSNWTIKKHTHQRMRESDGATSNINMLVGTHPGSGNYNLYLDSNRVNYLGNGRLGIGTTTPTRTIDIVSAEPNFRLSDSTGGGGDTVFSSVFGGAGKPGFGTITNHEMAIYTSGTRRMTTTAGGLVGVGITLPVAPLHVSGTIRTDDKFNIDGNDGWTGTFTNGDANTVTVSGGIIISVA